MGKYKNIVEKLLNDETKDLKTQIDEIERDKALAHSQGYAYPGHKNIKADTTELKRNLQLKEMITKMKLSSLETLAKSIDLDMSITNYHKTMNDILCNLNMITDSIDTLKVIDDEYSLELHNVTETVDEIKKSIRYKISLVPTLSKDEAIEKFDVALKKYKSDK